MWTELSALLQDGVTQGLFPGCAVCVRTDERVLFSKAFGQAELWPCPRPATLDTPYDLASITKVLGTTPLMMRLVAQGIVDLDAPIELQGAPEGVTPAHCLSHASGLPAWEPLFETFNDQDRWGTPALREAALRMARSRPVEAPPGSHHRYSDLGMMLLCAHIEARTHTRIDTLWTQQVAPHHGAELRWGWPDAAATEDCPVRQRVVVGAVHDLNTAVLGGASTHAGLFGPVEQAAAAAAWQLRAWHGEAGEGLEPQVVQRFWSHVGPGSHRLGWDAPAPADSPAGPHWPRDGLGHTGFTGGSVWIAPRQRLIVALTANRVHPVVEGGSRPGVPMVPRLQAFQRLRPALHTAVLQALGISD